MVTRSDGDGLDAGADAAIPYVRPAHPDWPQSEALIDLPHGQDATYAFEVQADVGKLDLHLSIDSTSSFGGEIDELRRQLAQVVVPGLDARVPDVAYGVSRFEDFPIAPYGLADDVAADTRPDRPFELLSPITKSRSKLSSAVSRLAGSLGYGGDEPESGAEALWQIATGEGFEYGGTEYVEPFEPAADAEGVLGGVGFRAGSLPVVLHVTDAPSHGFYPELPGTHDLSQAADALVAIGARVVAIHSGGDTDHRTDRKAPTRVELEQLADATGAVIEATGGACRTGIDGSDVAPLDGRCPLVFDIDESGQGLSETLVAGVITLLDHVRFGAVQGRIGDDPLGFVRHVEAIASEGDDGAPRVADELPAAAPDGTPDTFLSPRRGDTLRFEVALRNDVIRPTSEEQRFRVAIEVHDESVLLERRELAIRVPAGVFDAGIEDDADAGQ